MIWVEECEAVTEAVLEAMAWLVPQLSSSSAAPFTVAGRAASRLTQKLKSAP